MSYDALRALATDVTFTIMGVAATIRRPAPNDDPIETTGIWLERMKGSSFDEEIRPTGTNFQRRDPRKIFAVVRTASLPSLPDGTTIEAPELEDGDVVTWRVDGIARPMESDLMAVNLIRVSAF